MIAWNTLLGAFGTAGDMDGAYEVWQNMLQSGLTPDRHTQVCSRLNSLTS